MKGNETMKKLIECDVVVNTRWGYVFQPYHAKSITEGVNWARKSGGFAYRVFVNGKLVRRGFCE